VRLRRDCAARIRYPDWRLRYFPLSGRVINFAALPIFAAASARFVGIPSRQFKPGWT
jgi:hypothetical protein